MVVSSLSGQHYSQKTPDHLLEDEDEDKFHHINAVIERLVAPVV